MESDPSIKVLPPVLTTQDVSELLNLNVRTVLAMAQDGRLPAHRLPGSRKIQYLTAEILETVARSSLAESTGDLPAEPASAAEPTPAEMDPCEVWSAAPSRTADEADGRWVVHWMELARKAGLSPIDVSSSHLGAVNDGVVEGLRSTQEPAFSVQYDPEAGPACRVCVGAVEIDGLAYEVRVGPRQRIRYVDDDGEVRWGLIDAVWVEPMAQPRERCSNLSLDR